MKLLISTIILLLLFGISSNAQNNNIPRMTEEQLRMQDRKIYAYQTERYLRNYYEILLLNIGDLMIQESFITNHMDAEQKRYMPEFLLSSESDGQYLNPDQYLLELDKQFGSYDTEHLHITVDNFSINQNDFFVPSMISCYVIAEYDLTLKEDNRTLFKRRCKAYCLFPNVAAYINVKLLQIEPIRDIIAYQPIEKNIEKTVETQMSSSSTQEKAAPSLFDYVGEYDKDTQIALIRQNGKYGFLHKDGTLIALPIYESVYFSLGGTVYDKKIRWRNYISFMSAKKDGKWGMIDKNGKIAIPFEYEKIQDYYGVASDGIWACKEGLYGCLDKLADIIIPFKYEYKIELVNGRPAKTKLNGKYGYVNSSGKVTVPFIYEDTGGFSVLRKLAWVKKDGLYGFIDKGGNLVIPCQYRGATSFEDERASVQKNGKWGVIDLEGNLVVPFIYDFVFAFWNRLAIVKIGNKYGAIDEQGNVVVPIKYDRHITRSSNGKLIMELNGKRFYVDHQGNESDTED